MTFKPRCPKCKFALFFEPCNHGHPTAGCSYCGWRLMGEGSIRTLVETQMAAYREEQQQELRRRHKAELAELKAKKEVSEGEDCAWGPCDHPRRETSIYCSRDCSNKNARHRHSLRKQAQRREAAM